MDEIKRQLADLKFKLVEGENNILHQKILAQAPMLIVEDSQVIIFANERVNSIFSFIYNELEGKQLRELIPVRLRSQHDLHFSKYFENPSYRGMGIHNMDLVGMKKGGEEFKVKIQLEPWAHDTKWYVTATIIET
jgi:PAS domain S-box-containing protein